LLMLIPFRGGGYGSTPVVLHRGRAQRDWEFTNKWTLPPRLLFG